MCHCQLLFFKKVNIASYNYKFCTAITAALIVVRNLSMACSFLLRLCSGRICGGCKREYYTICTWVPRHNYFSFCCDQYHFFILCVS